MNNNGDVIWGTSGDLFNHQSPIGFSENGPKIIQNPTVWHWFFFRFLDEFFSSRVLTGSRNSMFSVPAMFFVPAYGNDDNSGGAGGGRGVVMLMLIFRR